MIANTQANPLSSLLAAINPAATQSLGSATGASQPRFDLTLLEMTKQVVDSAVAGSENTVVVPEKVNKALESVLNTLMNQSPENQMQAFSQDAPAVKVQNLVIDQAAGAGNLTVSEHKQLNELVGMAVQKVQSSLQPVIALPAKPAEEVTRALPVMHSGPMGGTTAPTSIDSIDSTFTAPEPVALKDEKEISKQLPQLAAALQAPIIVSTRTQVNAETNAETTNPISGIQSQPKISSVSSVQEPQAIVLTTQAPKPVEANEPAPQMTMPTNRPQQPLEVANRAAISPEPTEAITQISNQTPSSMQAPKAAVSEATKETVKASETVQPSGTQSAQQPQQQIVVKSDGQPQVQVIAQPNTIEAAQVEILSSTSLPTAIVPGSEITLKGIEPEVSAPLPVIAQALPVEAAPQIVTPNAIQPLQQIVQPEAAQPIVPQANVTPIAAPVTALETPVAVTAAVPVVNNQTAPTAAVAVDTQESRTITPMKRFMDENELRSSLLNSTGFVKAPVALTRDSFKDLAASITKEYSLRENVFQQAIAAIEDASQSTSQIRIVLKPESLGTMEVSLSMEGGKLTAKLIASSNEVRDIFAANLTQFKQALESQGLQVNQLSVAVRADSSTQGQQQSWQQNQPAWQLPANDEVPQLAANPFASFSAPSDFSGSSSTFNALA